MSLAKEIILLSAIFILAITVVVLIVRNEYKDARIDQLKRRLKIYERNKESKED